MTLLRRVLARGAGGVGARAGADRFLGDLEQLPPGACSKLITAATARTAANTGFHFKRSCTNYGGRRELSPGRPAAGRSRLRG